MKHKFVQGLLVAMLFLLPTALRAQVAIPITQGFEGDDWDSDGWVSEVGYQSGSAAETGSYGWQIGYSYDGYLISPELTGTDEGLQMVFSYRQNDNSYGDEEVKIGYTSDDISDEFDEDEWEWYETMWVSNTTWETYTANLPAGTKYVCIRYVAHDAYYLYVDNIILREPPSCLPVTDLAVSNVTTEGLTLTWADDANSDVTYTLTYTVDGEEMTVSGITGNSYDVTGLSAWTTYTFTVVANCSDGDADAASITAKTACSSATCEVELQVNGNHFYYGYGHVEFIQNDEVIFSYPTSSYQSSSATVEVCPVAPIKVYSVYDYTYYTGTITVFDGGGAEVYSGNYNDGDEDEGLVYVMANPCPTCFRPQNFVFSDTTTDGMTLSWDAGNDETEWIVYLDGEYYDNATTNTITFSGLEPNTAHVASFRSYCQEGDTSSAISVEFRTACASATCEVSLELSSTYAYGNPFTYYSGAASVELVQNGGSLGAFSSNTSIEVCGSAPISFVYHGCSYSEDDGYAHIVVRDGGNTVVYEGGSGDTVYTLDIPCPSCLPPTALNIDSTDIGEDHLTFYWTARSDASQFVVYLNDSLINDAVYDTFFYFDGLESNTAYKLSVQAVCVPYEDSSSVAHFDARTSCPQVMPLPFSEDFDTYDNGVFPACWHRVVASGTDPSVNNVYHASGTQSMFMQTSAGGLNVFCTPMAVPLAGDQIYVRFNAFMSYSTGYYNTEGNWLKVGVMTDPEDTSTFIMLDSIPNHNFNNVFEEYEVKTSGLDASAEYYIAWMFYGQASYNTYNRAAIDDIYINEYSGCDRPMTVEVSDITPFTATLTWEEIPGAVGYTVCYNTENNQATATEFFTTSDTVLTLTGLDPQTTYFAWVRTECGGNPSEYKAFPYFSTQISCAPVQNVTAEHITYVAAELSWSFNTAVGFPSSSVQVTLVDNTDADTTVYEVEGTSHLFRDLESGHSYTAFFRNLCEIEEFTGRVDTSTAVNYSFMTSSCSEISSPEHTTDMYYPYYNSQYAYAQNLYLQEQMPPVDTIRGVAFNAVSNGSTKTVDVYLAHTDITDLTASSYVATDELVLMASDVEMSIAAGWNVINFDTFFVYNGTDNLVVAIHQKSGGYSSANYWYNIPVEGSQGLEWISSGSIDITSLGSPSGDNGKMPEIRFVSNCEAPTCYAPMLHITNVDSNEVDVTWYKIGTESNFFVKYRAVGEENFNQQGVVSDTVYYFTDLTPNTPYEFYIGSICGEGDTTWSHINARTNCGSLLVPYYNDFENEDINAAPTCWDILQPINYSSTQTFPRIESQGYNGGKSMRFYGSGTAVVATDVIPLHADSINVRFMARVGSSQTIEAGMISDITDLSTFVPIDTVNTSSYEEYEFNTLGLLSTTDQWRLAFRFTSTYQNAGSDVDNISIRKDDGCHRAKNIVAEGDTASVYEAHATWTNDGNTMDHILVYHAANIDVWDTVEVTGTSYDFTGLNSATTYYFRIGTLCSEDTLWISEISFTTGCAPMEVPYFEDFDAYAQDVMPPCWGWNSSNHTHHDGGLFFKSYNNNAPAVMPLMEAPISKTTMTFKVKVGTPAENDGVLLGVADDEGNLIEWIDTIQDQYFSRNAYVWVTYNFIDYAGEGTRIAIGQLRSWNEWMCVDDISVDQLTDCLPPTGVQAVNYSNPNHTTFAWNTLAEANQWDVYVDTVTFVMDSVDSVAFVTVDDSSYTIPAGTLIGGGKYNFYVRTRCGDEITSEWTAFEFGAGTIVMNNSSTPDTVTGCGMVIYDNGYIAGYLSNSNSSLVVYADPGKELQITGGKFGWGTDAINFTVYDGVGTSGNILYQVQHSGSSTNDVIDSILATTTEGAMTITFTSGYSAHTGYELYVHCVDGATCFRPTNVAAVAVSYDTVKLIWEGNATSYKVYYTAEGSTNEQTTTVYDTVAVLTGLDAQTTYNVTVRGFCSADDSSLTSHNYSFTTLCTPTTVDEDNPFFEDFEGDISCFGQVYGDGDPSVNAMNVTQSEYVSGTHSFRFSSTSTSTDYNEYLITPMLSAEDNMVVQFYAKTSVSNAPLRIGYSTTGRDVNGDFAWNDAVSVSDSWVALTATVPAATKFIAINYAPTASAYYLYVDSLYIYVDAEGTVCLAPTITSTSVNPESIEVNFSATGTVEAAITTGAWNSSITGTTVTGTSYTFNGLTPGTTYTIGLRTVCSDDNASAWTTQTFTTPETPCDVPTEISTSNVTYTGATISWNGGTATKWQIRYSNGDDADTVTSEVTAYVLENLEPGTSYNVLVRAECDVDKFSDWSNVASFTTLTCETPVNIVASEITLNSAKLDWVSAAGKWELDLNGTVTEITSKPYTLTGLTEATDYTVKLRAICDDGIYSDWSAEQYFTTASCTAPTNVVVTDITTTSAKVDWTSTASEWEIQLNNQVIAVTTHPYTLTGLEPDKSYSVQVRAICDADHKSGWSDTKGFSTEKEGIDDVDGNAAITLYPNPASTTVTLDLDGVEGTVLVTLVDLNGRSCGQWSTGDGKLTIDLSQYARGTYFVRVAGSNTTAVRKLIVQ